MCLKVDGASVNTKCVFQTASSTCLCIAEWDFGNLSIGAASNVARTKSWPWPGKGEKSHAHSETDRHITREFPK